MGRGRKICVFSTYELGSERTRHVLIWQVVFVVVNEQLFHDWAGPIQSV